MAEIPQIVVKNSGYKHLIVYNKSDLILEGTIMFCRRFLPAHGDRTVDQMTQAARSCKQNIAEGSAASGTSKETEIKLTNVARATLAELIEDYLDYLKSHGLAQWPKSDEKAIYAKNRARQFNDWADWKEVFETRPAETLANLMLTICSQEAYMLGKMIERQEADFKKFGGIRERMHAARTAAPTRRPAILRPSCPRCLSCLREAPLLVPLRGYYGMRRSLRKQTELVSPTRTRPTEECGRFSKFSPTRFQVSFMCAFGHMGENFESTALGVESVLRKVCGERHHAATRSTPEVEAVS